MGGIRMHDTPAAEGYIDCNDTCLISFPSLKQKVSLFNYIFLSKRGDRFL